MNRPSPLQPPTLRPDLPSYPPHLQLIRVTPTTIVGPSGTPGVSSANLGVVAPYIYVSVTQQLTTDTLLPRDREPCLVLDVRGTGLLPGYYLGRLAGTFQSLPLYEVYESATTQSTLKTFSGVKVGRSTFQSMTEGGQTEPDFNIVIWENELYDTDNYWDAANPTRITIPSNGYYLITFNGIFEQGGADPTYQQQSAKVYYNDDTSTFVLAPDDRVDYSPPQSGENIDQRPLRLNYVTKLRQSDYMTVSVVFFNISNANRGFGSLSTFSVAKLGDY